MGVRWVNYVVEFIADGVELVLNRGHYRTTEAITKSVNDSIEFIGNRRRHGSPESIVDGLRFLLDPFRQSSWGFSAGGGISLLAREGDHVRPQLLVALDLEGPRSRSGVSPSIQVGLGGGVRAGIGLRWGSAGVR